MTGHNSRGRTIFDGTGRKRSVRERDAQPDNRANPSHSFRTTRAATMNPSGEKARCGRRRRSRQTTRSALKRIGTRNGLHGGSDAEKPVSENQEHPAGVQNEYDDQPKHRGETKNRQGRGGSEDSMRGSRGDRDIDRMRPRATRRSLAAIGSTR